VSNKKWYIMWYSLLRAVTTNVKLTHLGRIFRWCSNFFVNVILLSTGSMQLYSRVNWSNVDWAIF